VNEEVRQIEPDDYELDEEWLRETGEPGIRNVSACYGSGGGWQVTVWAMEFVREEPLRSRLRRRVEAALLAVDGVTDALEQSRETWHVLGTPSGRPLTEAVARAVDDLADEIRDHYRSLFPGRYS
jgi:hypothetical protein